MERLALSIPERFNVGSHFVDANLVAGRGDSLAILFEEQQLTYREVAVEVQRAANALARTGIGRGDRVLLLLLDSPAFVAAFWGAIKRGAVAVPVNTLLTPEDYEFILRDSGARVLIVHDVLFEKVAPALARHPGLKVVWVAGRPADGAARFEDVLAREPAEAEAAATYRDDPAFWLYTSGSTGRPKAAIHRHRDMVYCFEGYARGILRMTAADRTFSASKLFFAYGLGNALYFPFGVGASTVLLAERPTGEKAVEMIRRYRPTVFFAVPTLYAALLQVADAQPADFASVRLAVSAGEALPASLWERCRERFGLEILDGIGSTEMLHMFISNRPGEVVPGSSGRPVPGYEARVVDEQGNDVAPGQIGSLWIRGASAAAGYWNRPELTAATFREEWTVTGDKYIRDAGGYYFYCGRTDDMLKVSGLWVSPLEIETALLAHPQVIECAVVGATDRDGLTKPKAFVVTRQPDSGALEPELREFLRERLPGYKIPEWIVFAETLPKTATGKIQRFKLRQAAAPAT